MSPRVWLFVDRVIAALVAGVINALVTIELIKWLHRP